MTNEPTDLSDLGDPPKDTRKCVEFCVQQLDAAETFSEPISWHTEIVTGLTVEETIGALLAAERDLNGGKQ